MLENSVLLSQNTFSGLSSFATDAIPHKLFSLAKTVCETTAHLFLISMEFCGEFHGLLQMGLSPVCLCLFFPGLDSFRLIFLICSERFDVLLFQTQV